MTKKLCVIRVRGSLHLREDVRDTLDMLHLHEQNHCVVLTSTPSLLGMLAKVKDFITWGEIDAETETLLKQKAETMIKKGKELARPYYRLHPPAKGYGRKGVKVQFVTGGALGDRGTKINDLIKRMIL